MVSALKLICGALHFEVRFKVMTFVAICGEGSLTLVDLDRERTAFPKSFYTMYETTVLSKKESEVSFLNPHPGLSYLPYSTVASGMSKIQEAPPWKNVNADPFPD